MLRSSSWSLALLPRRELSIADGFDEAFCASDSIFARNFREWKNPNQWNNVVSLRVDFSIGHWYFRTQVYYFHTTSKFVRSKRPNNPLNFYFFSLFLFLCSLSSLSWSETSLPLSEKWVVGPVEGGQQRLVKDARSRGLRCHVGRVRRWGNQKSRGVAVAAHADGGASLCRQCRVWGDSEWIFVTRICGVELQVS